MAKNDSDQIRRLDNRVVLSGALAEFEYTEGKVASSGVPYIRVKGWIQCGETAQYRMPFSAFVKATKANGEDNDNYDTWKKWCKTAVSMVKDKENPTMVKLVGSLSSNPYVGSDGELHEYATQNSMSFIYDFDEYAATLDIEGYIKGVSEETNKDGETTGRMKIRLITMDFFHNVLDMNNIIVPADLVDALDENEYEAGRTAKLYASWLPNEAPKPAKTSGFGQQRTTEGRSYMELILVGGDTPYDEESDKALTTAQAKQMVAERKAQMAEIEEKGYQGTNTSKNRAGFNGKKTGTAKTSTAKASHPVEDDDEIPF